MSVRQSIWEAARLLACHGRSGLIFLVRALGLGPVLTRVTWPRAGWALVITLIAVHGFEVQGRTPPREGVRADLDCLALNIYHEARGETLEGKRAVGHVVMNRVADRNFPASVCQVVRDGGEGKLHQCQFSWWCDGVSDKPIETAAWQESRAIAWDVLRGASNDPTGGALWYHADYAAPDWRGQMSEVKKIGRHIFYQRPD